MIKLATSGGLGDAAMAYAKIFSAHAPFTFETLDDIELIHLTNKRGKGKFEASLQLFYKSQGITNSSLVLLNKGGSHKWLKNNGYDYYLGSAWCADNGDYISWDVEPFPPFNYTSIPDIDVVISPVSQWDMGRVIPKDQLMYVVDKFKDRHITYVGWAPPEYTTLIDKLPGTSMLNQGNVSDLTNIICSSTTVIGTIGFVTQLGGLANKKVIWTGSVKPDDRFHPQCDSTYLTNLKEL
jgi:hypothetical protein